MTLSIPSHWTRLHSAMLHCCLIQKKKVPNKEQKLEFPTKKDSTAFWCAVNVSIFSTLVSNSLDGISRSWLCDHCEEKRKKLRTNGSSKEGPVDKSRVKTPINIGPAFNRWNIVIWRVSKLITKWPYLFKTAGMYMFTVFLKPLEKRSLPI